MAAGESTVSGVESSRSFEVAISPEVQLHGDLDGPAKAPGIVIFAHGSGSSRFSPRNRQVAERLRAVGLQTLLFDLLTRSEEAAEEAGGMRRFDIPLLAGRLAAVTDRCHAIGPRQRIGYFGASTGAAAALVAAADRPALVSAVVSRGGRPDLAGDALERVEAPTLLIVGALDPVVVELNREAAARLGSRTETVVISGAGHLFEEPGTLEAVADLAAAWFGRYLSGAASTDGLR